MLMNHSWQDYMEEYYDFAIKQAAQHLKKSKGRFTFWDTRIDEEAIINDAAVDALENAYQNYDPSKGELKPYLSRAIHNEVANKLKAETNALSRVKDLTPKQENDYTIKDLSREIPPMTRLKLQNLLRDSIEQLKPIDQTILEKYLENPKTYIENASKSLCIDENLVSVRKTRAIAQLRVIMKPFAQFYRDYEPAYFGGSTTMLQMITVKPVERYQNPISPDFDLDKTVQMLLDALEIK